MSWFNCRHVRPAARCRLICFPWSGGGSAFYAATWGNAFPPYIEVIGVRLPGRESRMGDSLHTDIGVLTEQLAHQIHQSYSDKPYAFFGHSMGSTTCFETALTLQKKYNESPCAMFFSGTFAPNSVVRKERSQQPNPSRWSQKSDDQLLDIVTNLGGTPQVLLDDSDYMRNIFLPAFRADLTVTDLYWYDLSQTSHPPLSCSVTCFDGKDDEPHHQQEFQLLTSGAFQKHELPGKHFYLLDKSNTEAIAGIISDVITDSLEFGL